MNLGKDRNWGRGSRGGKKPGEEQEAGRRDAADKEVSDSRGGEMLVRRGAQVQAAVVNPVAIQVKQNRAAAQEHHEGSPDERGPSLPPLHPRHTSHADTVMRDTFSRPSNPSGSSPQKHERPLRPSCTSEGVDVE